MKNKGTKISLHDKCCDCGKMIDIEISSDGELSGYAEDILDALGFAIDIAGEVICIPCMRKNFDMAISKRKR